MVVSFHECVELRGSPGISSARQLMVSFHYDGYCISPSSQYNLYFLDDIALTQLHEWIPVRTSSKLNSLTTPFGIKHHLYDV